MMITCSKYPATVMQTKADMVCEPGGAAARLPAMRRRLGIHPANGQ